MLVCSLELALIVRLEFRAKFPTGERLAPFSLRGPIPFSSRFLSDWKDFQTSSGPFPSSHGFVVFEYQSVRCRLRRFSVPATPYRTTMKFS